MSRPHFTSLPLLAAVALFSVACGDSGKTDAPSGAGPSALPANLDRGLLLSLSQFEVAPDGKVLPRPGPARLEILVRQGGRWDVSMLDDPQSNVFHKAMEYKPVGAAPGILTLGGSEAALKLWRRKGSEFQSETLWTEDFGGKFSRMRDAEVGDLFGSGTPDLAVATHDQGVVAVVRAKKDGGWFVDRIDHEPDTFVHEIEIGDVNGDGAVEVYATPSEPNRLDGTAQTGSVVRYVPSKQEGPTEVADLGNRHAKEIYVGDVDGDGRDELYVSVEAHTEKDGNSIRIVEPVEIRRYDADTPANAGRTIATLDDRLCRFLTVGDLDGDGKKEMVAAAFRSGIWLLRPTAGDGEWSIESIDRDSSGFEHAALMADLDGDGTDELYVASDDQGEVRRYTFNGGAFHKEVIYTRKVRNSAFTWNIVAVPVSLVR